MVCPVRRFVYLKTTAQTAAPENCASQASLTADMTAPPARLFLDCRPVSTIVHIKLLFLLSIWCLRDQTSTVVVGVLCLLVCFWSLDVVASPSTFPPILSRSSSLLLLLLLSPPFGAPLCSFWTPLPCALPVLSYIPSSLTLPSTSILLSSYPSPAPLHCHFGLYSPALPTAVSLPFPHSSFGPSSLGFVLLHSLLYYCLVSIYPSYSYPPVCQELGDLTRHLPLQPACLLTCCQADVGGIFVPERTLRLNRKVIGSPACATIYTGAVRHIEVTRGLVASLCRKVNRYHPKPAVLRFHFNPPFALWLTLNRRLLAASLPTMATWLPTQ